MIETKEQTTASMIIRYQLTIDDWLAFNRFYQKTSPISRNQIQRAKILYTLIVIFAALATIFVLSKTISFIAIVLVGFVGLIVYMTIENFFVARMDKNARRVYESGQNKTLREMTTLTISPDHIESQSSLLESRMKWPLVEKVAIEQDYIFIFVSANQAIIIPNRAFQHAAQRQECIGCINRYHTVKYA